MSDIPVAQAVKRYHELDALTSDMASDEERQFLHDEAVQDPYYGPSLEASRLLGELAGGLASLVEHKSQEDSEQPGVGEQPPTEDEFDRIADLDGYDEQRERAERQVEAIEKTQQFISCYRVVKGGKRTTKQQRELKRTLSSAYREAWTTAELAEDPETLRTILSSIDASPSIGEKAKEELGEFIASKVREHVIDTAAQTHPDSIAKRLLVALEPSVCSDQLVGTLIKPYFNAAEGRGVEVVLDNYETFLRGVLRTADSPHVMATALDIAKFKTQVLPKDGLYAHHLMVTPLLRLDRPELLGRYTGIGKAIGQLDAHLTSIASFMATTDSSRASAVDIFGETNRELQRLTDSNPSPSDLIKQYKGIRKDMRFASLVHNAGQAVTEAIGLEEYSDRLAAMELYHKILGEGIEGIIGSLIQTGAENGNISVGHTIDIVIDRVTAQHPAQAQFLRTLALTESLVQDELPDYITDPTANVLDLIDNTQGLEFLTRVIGAVAPDTDEAPLSTEDVEKIGEQLQMTVIELGDGYVLEFMEQKGMPYPTPQEIEDILAPIGAERIQQAKLQMDRNTGSRRRHEMISDPDLASPVIIRRENEQDRKAIHPINELVELFGTVAEDLETPDDTEARSLIEENVVRIIDERRRFLNERGIMIDLSDSDDDFTMTVHKHPGNRKAFIVDIALRNRPSGTAASARILMDDRLRFRLGNKRVRQQSPLLMLNLLASDLVTHFACQEAIETTEGRIEGNKGLVERIAHLRLLPEGQKRSDDRWYRCLEVEGLDLDVLGKQQQEKLNTSRVTTYVEAVESDGEDKGPIVITDLFDA